MLLLVTHTDPKGKPCWLSAAKPLAKLVVWILVGAFLVLGFFWFGLDFFEWSFLLFFFSFGIEQLCIVLPSLLCRMSERGDCSLSASAWAPSHQRHQLFELLP